ncbi:hypothetical protein I4U23_031119 [Adineta vaga]|nr:hypothetical protein I4U23_031119 [Adineta vaga]
MISSYINIHSYHILKINIFVYYRTGTVNILSELIESDLPPEQAEYKVLFLHKRVIVNYKLQHFDLVIQDAVKPREMGSAISWDDEIFSMEQEAIMNVAIDQVAKHLEETKCESNILFIESTMQLLQVINPKGIFDRTANDFVQYAK